MHAASLLNATTPNKAAVMQVRAASYAALSVLMTCKENSVKEAVLHLDRKSNFLIAKSKNCLCFRSDFNKNQLFARL